MARHNLVLLEVNRVEALRAGGVFAGLVIAWIMARKRRNR
jgi:hypothetical protein